MNKLIILPFKESFKYLKEISQKQKINNPNPFNIESENILRSRKGNEHSSCAKIQSNNTTATQRKKIKANAPSNSVVLKIRKKIKQCVNKDITNESCNHNNSNKTELISKTADQNNTNSVLKESLNKDIEFVCKQKADEPRDNLK